MSSKKAITVVLVMIAFLMLVLPPAFTQAISLGDTIEFDGHYYYLAPQLGATWQQAQSYAASETLLLDDGTVLKGHLLTINNEAEQDFISSTYMSQWMQLHLGAYQYSRECETDGAWAWVTGEEVGNIRNDWTYSYLSPGEPGDDPNPYSDNEDVLRILVNDGRGTPPGTQRDTWHDFPSAAPEEPGAWWLRCVVEFDQVGDHFVRLDAPPSNVLLCSDFDPPLDGGPVTVATNWVLPLSIELRDSEGFAVTDLDIGLPPVLQVTYTSVGQAEDVTDELLPPGLRTKGNQFEFDGAKWRFNLQTNHYTAPGTYTVRMVSGDVSEYLIGGSCAPCEGRFVVE